MDNVYIVAIITIAVVTILFLVLPMLYKKFNNVNFEQLFDSTNNILEAINIIIQNIAIPEDKRMILNLITTYATQAVQYAEQLYISGQLEEDLRKEKAVEYVKQILTLSEIEITDEIEQIIDATIESAVLLLPKTHTEATTAKRERAIIE